MWQLFLVVLLCIRIVYGSTVSCKPYLEARANYNCFIKNLTAVEINEDKLSLSLPPGIFHKEVFGIIIGHNEPSIYHIPKELFALFPNLKFLSIHSEINEITADDLMNASKLYILHLKSNKLHKLSAGTFQLVRLDELNLENEEIETIEDFTFANQSALEYLFLKQNKINTITRNTFAGLSALETLDLSENEIQTIENGAFCDSAALLELYLSHNKIRALNNHVFDGLTALELLSITNNQIETIGNSLWTLVSVKTVQLQFNRIIDVDFVKFAKLPKLKILNLRATDVNLGSLHISSNETLSSPLKFLHVGFLNNFTSAASPDVLKRIYPKLKVLYLSGSNSSNHETLIHF